MWGPTQLVRSPRICERCLAVVLSVLKLLLETNPLVLVGRVCPLVGMMLDGYSLVKFGKANVPNIRFFLAATEYLP